MGDVHRGDQPQSPCVSPGGSRDPGLGGSIPGENREGEVAVTLSRDSDSFPFSSGKSTSKPARTLTLILGLICLVD